MKRKPRALEGVTLNGVPLLSALEKLKIPTEEQREIAETKERVHTYRRPVLRVKTQNERNGEVRRLMEEVNKANYENYMKSFVKAKDPKGGVVAIILCNHKKLEYADLCSEYIRFYNQAYGSVKGGANEKTICYSIRSIIGKLRKSQLSGFLNVSKRTATKPVYYWLTEEGYKLTLEQALTLANQKNDGFSQARAAAEAAIEALPKQASPNPAPETERPAADISRAWTTDLPGIRVEFLGPITITGVNIYLGGLESPETKTDPENED
jgi:hypothetical protein